MTKNKGKTKPSKRCWELKNLYEKVKCNKFEIDLKVTDFLPKS